MLRLLMMRDLVGAVLIDTLAADRTDIRHTVAGKNLAGPVHHARMNAQVAKIACIRDVCVTELKRHQRDYIAGGCATCSAGDWTGHPRAMMQHQEKPPRRGRHV